MLQATQPEWWKYLVDIAQVLAAFGTCAAVIVALYIANAPPKLHMQGYAGLRILIGGNVPEGLKPEYLNISITNCGHREFVLSSFGWESSERNLFVSTIRRILKRPRDDELHALQMLGYNDEYIDSDPLPNKLLPGQSTKFFLPNFGPQNWFARLTEKNNIFLKNTKTRQDLERLRLNAFTSVGVTYSIKPEKPVLDLIWLVLEKSAVSSESLVGKRNIVRRFIDWPS